MAMFEASPSVMPLVLAVTVEGFVESRPAGFAPFVSPPKKAGPKGPVIIDF